MLSSLCASIVRVASRPSCTSNVWTGARSICVYCLAAASNAEMRSTASVISSSRPSDSRARTGYERPTARYGGGITCAKRSSQLRSTPDGDERGCDVHCASDAAVLEPVAQLFLTVGRLQRRQDRGIAALIEGASGQVGDRFELLGGELATGEVPDLLPHLGEHVSQPRARAQDRRHRIVEFVRETGRHRTERDEALVPGDGVGGGPALDLESRQQVGGHREPFPYRTAEVGRRAARTSGSR